jgi:hypothetical protein
MLSMESGGNTAQTEAWLKRMMSGRDLTSAVIPQAQRGVDALIAGTPTDSGLTADSWGYEIKEEKDGLTIYWTNSNIQHGFSVALGIQYGHGTGDGAWIEGYDFINPAIRPIFDQIAEAVWKEVIK